MQKLVNNTPFGVVEELLENYHHIVEEDGSVVEGKLIDSIGKNNRYVRKALHFLYLMELLVCDSEKVKMSSRCKELMIERQLPSSAVIKKSIVSYKPFLEYCNLRQKGKTEKVSARLLIAKEHLNEQPEKVVSVFNDWLLYLDKGFVFKKFKDSKISSISQNSNFLWVDEEGKLNFDEEAYTQKIVNNLEKNRINNQFFIDINRINELADIKNNDYDLSKLICFCEELNSGYRIGNYCSVAVIVRALIDHVPPIFGKKNFAEVANNYGSKSFKDNVQNLDQFARKIADSIMHSHIRKIENIPNASTVDCKNALDVLLGEVVVLLK